MGCFPDGASPYGVLDMSGNVWDGREVYGVTEEYPYDANDGRENLDAGAYVPRVLRGGAFDVYYKGRALRLPPLAQP